MQNYKICVAPMLDWTDTHCRYFHRLLSPNAMLYSEMLTTGAILNHSQKYLEYNHKEHPLALQIGGSDPKDLEACAKIAKRFNYDELNLNCGCPSERVQKGSFGACLMKETQLVADCYEAMTQADIRVSIKHRIGVDDIIDYEFLRDFVGALSNKGCEIFIVHARNAILKGLTPKENRSIPPLKYDYVYKLKQDFPNLTIIINGGINTIQDSLLHLYNVDGVMIGRAAYHIPYILTQLDNAVFNTPIANRYEILEKIIEYCMEKVSQGIYLGMIIRHILGLFHGEINSRLWRQHLSNHAYLKSVKTSKDIKDFFNKGNELLKN